MAAGEAERMELERHHLPINRLEGRHAAPAVAGLALCFVIALLTSAGIRAITPQRSKAPTPPPVSPPAALEGVSRAWTTTAPSGWTSSRSSGSECRSRGSYYVWSPTTSSTEGSSSGTTEALCLRGPTPERLDVSPERVMVDRGFRLVHIGGLGGWTWVIAPLCGGLVGFVLFAVAVVLTKRQQRHKRG